jgi:hypothetical protein
MCEGFYMRGTTRLPHTYLARVAMPAILAAALLTACPPSFPLKITRVSASPDPVVGRIVTLQVEITSTQEEDDVTINIHPPEGILLIDGDLLWHGSLRAGETATHSVSLCATLEGDWGIFVIARSALPGDETKYVDVESIHFISGLTRGQAIPGSQYTIVQGSPIPVLTPSPIPAPATCS